MFERFFRIPGNQTTGSGLGLSIIKLIANQDNAKINFKKGEKSGLGVEITFPYALKKT